MHRSLLLFFSMLALTFSLAACDSSGANDSEGDNQENEEEVQDGVDAGNSDAEGFVLEEGSFDATIDDEGEVTEVSGGAVFGIATNLDENGMGGGGSDGEGFMIYMLAGERPPEDDRSLTDTWTSIRITAKESTVPGEGTYTFESGGFAVPDYRNDMDSQEINTFIGGGPGEFVITSASDDELKGTFSFESPSSGDVQVEGTFTAARADDLDTVLCTPDCGE